MNWETLLCLGDSITIGARSYLGYPEYAGHFLQERTKKDWNVINWAVSGYTSIDLVRHIDKNWSSLKQTNPEVISIMIGTNDLKKGTELADFSIAYNQVLVKSKLLVGSKNIILNKIPQLQVGVMLPYKLKMNELAINYNNVITKIAEDNGLLLQEMQDSPEYFFDGVHLNNLGSRKWGEQLANTIISLRNE